GSGTRDRRGADCGDSCADHAASRSVFDSSARFQLRPTAARVQSGSFGGDDPAVRAGSGVAYDETGRRPGAEGRDGAKLGPAMAAAQLAGGGAGGDFDVAAGVRGRAGGELREYAVERFGVRAKSTAARVAFLECETGRVSRGDPDV